MEPRRFIHIHNSDEDSSHELFTVLDEVKSSLGDYEGEETVRLLFSDNRHGTKVLVELPLKVASEVALELNSALIPKGKMI